MSDETIRLEYWQCENCNSIYHVDPLDTIHKVDNEGLVHCAKDKIPMVKLKRKPAKQVPNIGLTNSVILKDFLQTCRNDNYATFTKISKQHFDYLIEQLAYSIQWQVKNRKLLDVSNDLRDVLNFEESLKDFWKSKYLDVEFEV